MSLDPVRSGPAPDAWLDQCLSQLLREIEALKAERTDAPGRGARLTLAAAQARKRGERSKAA